MNRYYVVLIFLILLILFLLTSCSYNGETIQQSESEEELEAIIEEISLSEDDFAPSINTLPYRGAVLFINYKGEVDLSDYVLYVDISHGKDVTQENMPVEEVDGNLVATIVDLMYLPGAELDFVISAENDFGEVHKFKYSLVYDGYYPWKDWMFDLSANVILDHNWHQFKYDYPDCSNRLGSHSSWDFYDGGKMLNVYSGTVGVVFRIPPACIKGNLEIYNPYVGAIVQYGHTKHADKLYIGKDVEPGEHIANVEQPWDHLHYSVIRPYRYIKYIKGSSSFQLPLDLSDMWDGYYFPIISEPDRFIYHDSYNDPFYWHEPTTLGYWYENTLPDGFKNLMIEIFQRENPNVILPAKEPLNN